MKLKDALAALAKMYAEEGVDGDTEILDPDGFEVVGFKTHKFEEDDKERNCKKGDVIIEVDSFR